MNRRHAVVLAGGLGTRALELTGGVIPKALLEVAGKPFLQLKIESLVEMGFDSATLLVGEMGDQIEYFIAAHEFQMQIEIIHDGDVLLGTAGSIRRALETLPERFWVTFGDSIVTTNLNEAEKFASRHHCSRIMTVLHNNDQIQTSNTTVAEGIVKSYEKRSQPGSHEWIDYGLLLLQKQDFEFLAMGQFADLGEVLSPIIASGDMCGFEVSHRFWDVGDPTGFQQTKEFFEEN